MRFLILPIFLLCSVYLPAQQLSGVVTAAGSDELLQKVFVENLSSGARATSGKAGEFSISVHQGDTLRFSLLGYQPGTLVILSGDMQQYQRITLLRQLMSIDTVVIRPDLTAYQRDSLNRRAIYGKKVDEKPAKFKVAKRHPLYGRAGEGTFRVDAPISALLQKRSAKYKRLKAFQKRYKENEQQLFIDTRYTPALVQELTGLQEEALVRFMNRYPMDYEFARAATELELMMWIRFNYRTWKEQQQAQTH